MLIDKIIGYESGELSDRETTELFAELIKTGQCWLLQGCYGRTANALIEQGVIDKTGKILVVV
jgi:hypothetical protein